MSEKLIIIEAYKRIRDAANGERGVRLSAKECQHIWFGDDAIRQAVISHDEAEQEQEQAYE